MFNCVIGGINDNTRQLWGSEEFKGVVLSASTGSHCETIHRKLKDAELQHPLGAFPGSPLTRLPQKDYSHRKEWIRSRQEELAGIFALDVMSFAVLSNHLHVVVRTRPDVVKSWSDEEVALRWWRLFPQRRDGNGKAAEPLESELKHILNNASGLKEKRRRLCDISWFMRCLAEPIARRGNFEDKVSGRFWKRPSQCTPVLRLTRLILGGVAA